MICWIALAVAITALAVQFWAWRLRRRSDRSFDELLTRYERRQR